MTKFVTEFVYIMVSKDDTWFEKTPVSIQKYTFLFAFDQNSNLTKWFGFGDSARFSMYNLYKDVEIIKGSCALWLAMDVSFFQILK